MAFDGSLNFDTAIDITGFKKGFATLSTLAKQGTTALATLSLNTLNSSIDVALSGLAKIGNITLDGLTESISLTVDGMSKLVTATDKFLSNSVETGKTFESSMSQVMATMGISKDTIQDGTNSYELLKQTAEEMGASTQFSASESADALNYLALAGYDATKACEALPTVLNIAAAGDMALADASDMVTDAMSALDIEATSDNLTDFGDKLAKTSQKSNTSVAQLGEAILTVGGTAKNLSGGITEMNTALGILADNGIKGAEGGTALRNMILALGSPTDNAKKQLDALGVQVYDTEGKMRPLNEIFGDLNKSMSTMTEEQKNIALSDIFNKVDLKSSSALLANCGERWNELSGYIKDADGACKEMAQTMNDNLEGDIKSLQSAFEGVQNSIYDVFMPSLRGLAQNGTKYLQELNNAFAVDGVAGLINVVSSLGDVLANSLDDNSDLFKNAILYGETLLNSFAEGITKNKDIIANHIVDFLHNGLYAFNDNFKNFYNLGFNLATTIGNGMAEDSSYYTSVVEDFITNISSTFSRYTPKLLKSGVTIVKAILKGTSNATNSVTKDITSLVNEIGKIFVDEFPEFVTLGTDILVSLIQGISDGSQQMDISVDDIITTIANAFADNGDRLLDCAWIIISSIGRGIGNNLPKLTQYALDIVLALSDFIGEHADEVGDGAVELITSLADTLITEDNLQKIIETALKIITKFTDGLLSEENVNKLAHTSKQIIESIGDTLLGETESDGNVLNDAVSAGANLGGKLISGLTDYLFEHEDNIFTAFTALLVDLEEYIGNNFWDLGSMATDAFISGLTGTEFSFEGFGEYLYDEFHSGDFWSNWVDESNDVVGGLLNAGGEIPTNVNINAGVNIDNANLQMQKAVDSNTATSENLSTATTAFAEALGAFDTYQKNQQTTVTLCLYPNSDVLDSVLLDSQNRLISTSGGHSNGN